MKTKIKYLGALVCLLITNVLLAAESPTSGGGGGSSIGLELPIWSPDVTREYALSKVVRGSRYVYSQSMDWDFEGRHSDTNVVGKGAEDVLGKLFSSELVYRLTNPDDTIQGYVYLYDANDNLLFYGYADFTATQLKQGMSPLYNIWIQNVPILSGVESAEILVLDQDGRTVRRIDLGVTAGGQVLWQPWYSGSPNGILIVRTKDGGLVRYDLAKPISQKVVGSSEVASFKVNGHYIVNAEIISEVKIVEVWERPTVFLKTSKQWVNIDVLGILQDGGKANFERPTHVVITSVESGVTRTVPLNSDSDTLVGFEGGTFRLYFLWIKFGQPGTIYTGPTDGGKG